MELGVPGPPGLLTPDPHPTHRLCKGFYVAMAYSAQPYSTKVPRASPSPPVWRPLPTTLGLNSIKQIPRPPPNT